MSNHVTHERLHEIANLRKASEATEWPHIRKCSDCSTQLIEFVREAVIAEGERLKAIKEAINSDSKNESVD